MSSQVEPSFDARMTTVAVHLARTRDPLGPEDFVSLPAGPRLQVCRATVATADAARVTLILATDAEAAPVTLRALDTLRAKEPAATIIALVRESADGRAAVEIGPEHAGLAPVVAAAVAVLQASWGWDESPMIVVTVNAVPVPVAPRFTPDGWTAGIYPHAV